MAVGCNGKDAGEDDFKIETVFGGVELLPTYLLRNTV